ncbi:hypothetical protein, partial [Rhodomicrobium sp.]|uniref:hypothetical protein n=1 Tax=Rhodomicrobium sp. TaxID=2720632 RepID=UPI0039E57839
MTNYIIVGNGWTGSQQTSILDIPSRGMFSQATEDLYKMVPTATQIGILGLQSVTSVMLDMGEASSPGRAVAL